MMPLGVLGWAFVGLVVAVIEKRLNAGRDPAGGRVTVLCIAGAVAGGFLGQALHPYAFGLPLGFVFAAAGAKVLLSLSRSRGLPTCVGADTTQRRSAASSVGIGLLEVVGWGGLGSVALGIAGYLGLLLGLTLWHPQQYSQFPVAFLLIPFGWFVGLVLTPVVRLARPRWTTAHMLFVVLVLSISYAALMVAGVRPTHRKPTYGSRCCQTTARGQSRVPPRRALPQRR